MAYLQIPGDVSRLIYSSLLPSLHDCTSFALTSKEIYISTVSSWTEQKINYCLDLWFRNELSLFHYQYALPHISSTVSFDPTRLLPLSQDQLEILFSKTSFRIQLTGNLQQMEALILRDYRIVTRLTKITISIESMGFLSPGLNLAFAQRINHLAGPIKKQIKVTAPFQIPKVDQQSQLFEYIVQLHLLGGGNNTPLIIEYCPNLTELTIRNNSSINQVALPPQLKRLDISGCTITSTWLEMILSKCPSLEFLDMAPCNFVGKFALKNIPPLLHLSSLVASGADITSASLVKLMSSSPKLEFIRISDCQEITDFDLDGAPQLLKLREVDLSSTGITSGLESLLSRTPNLEKLVTTNCSSISHLNNAPLLQRLHTVHLNGTAIPSAALKSLLMRSPNLETLVVDCKFIEGSLDLSDILSFPKLTSLEVHNCNEGILSLIGKCINLSKLHIVKCQPLREEVMPVLPKLTYLHLQQLKFSFAMLLQGLQIPNLQHLEISSCNSCGHTFSLPPLPHLKSLKFNRFNFVQDLQVLLTKYNHIESLKLRACDIILPSKQMPPLSRLTKLQKVGEYICHVDSQKKQLSAVLSLTPNLEELSILEYYLEGFLQLDPPPILPKLRVLSVKDGDETFKQEVLDRYPHIRFKLTKTKLRNVLF
jgi:hypothetical protein